MRLFGDPKVFRGSIAWTKPLRLKVTVFPRPRGVALEAPVVGAAPPAQAEYDEDGRLWVFRYAQSAPTTYRVDRNRIFTYMRRHRLPTEGVRQIRRDARNSIDVYSTLRELQTHSDVDTYPQREAR